MSQPKSNEGLIFMCRKFTNKIHGTFGSREEVYLLEDDVRKALAQKDAEVAEAVRLERKHFEALVRFARTYGLRHEPGDFIKREEILQALAHSTKQTEDLSSKS